MFNFLKLPLLALAFTVFATSSFAQNWGIRFDQMPVGTEYEMKWQNGDRYVSRYVGKQGRFYILEETNLQTGNKVRQQFNAQGHFVRGSNARGYNVKNVPNSCYYVVGPCTHFVRGTTRHTGKYVYNIKQIGATNRVGTWRRVTTEETRDFKYTIGKYNFVVYQEYKRDGRKITRTVTRISEPNG
ncbi:hypothetical protein [Planktotalea sp.]|uniref:hypothetical protein n=1 Tax=Planktotalea sp. TaxID=2029877 RepID=UPI003D6BB923